MRVFKPNSLTRNTQRFNLNNAFDFQILGVTRIFNSSCQRRYFAAPIVDNSSLALEKIRNFGISAHIDSGKTTLTERILFYTGRIKEIHDVRGKSGVGAKMDSMDLEREKGITIQSAATYCSWGDHHFNIIDTPGHVDFTIEVERALRVLDGAIMVVCAVGGVQAQTLTVHRQMCRYNVPRVIFINKMDRFGADPEFCMTQIKEKLGLNVGLIQVPIGAEDKFEGVVDVIRNRAVYFHGDSGEKRVYSDIPADLKSKVEDVRSDLVEQLADIDDDVAEAYLEAGDAADVDADTIIKAIRKSVIERTFAPIFVGTAFKNKGVQELLDGVNDYLPSPLDRTNKGVNTESEDEEVELSHDGTKPLIGYGFKIQDHPQAGVLTYMRIYQGTIRKNDSLFDMLAGKRVNPKRIVRMHSNEIKDVTEAGPGDIIALAGVEAPSGTTFTDGKTKIACTSMYVPDPVMSVSVKLTDPNESTRFGKAIGRFKREDPTFHMEMNTETKEMIMKGMGELHLEIYVERMKREFNVNVVVGEPKVSYRETIINKADFDYTHKRQTGGRGQYGKVQGYFEPIPEEERDENGENVQFVNLLSGQEIPPNYVPAIEKGFRDAAAYGWLTGNPMRNIRIVLVDGKAHENDSSDIAFRAAAYGAMKNCLEGACPIALEPLMKVDVTVPTVNQASTLQTLTGREGNILNTSALGHDATFIEALVPLRCMFGYSRELRSITQGQGEFSMDFHEYVPMPVNEQTKISENFKLPEQL